MQRKVSIVMPCYNKVDYIGEMFDSIIAQNWDNIELILVNDGSTDGTRKVIAEYEPKFRVRGFEVVIIDQENEGVCTAAKVGLERVTGDYLCMVDADDELSPIYVSAMAGWLEYDNDCDYCVCGGIDYTGIGVSKEFFSDRTTGKHEGDFLTEKYLLSVVRTNPWIYMLRTNYFQKCNIFNTYYTDTKGSHEPAYIIPILSFGGKYKYLPLPLYCFNKTGESHSRSNQFRQMKKYHNEYNELCKIAIEHLPEYIADSERKKKLICVANISRHIRVYRSARYLGEWRNLYGEAKALTELVDSVNEFFELKRKITIEQAFNAEEMLFQMLNNILTGRPTGYEIEKPLGRVIGYGAMGKLASLYLPVLMGTPLEPTELWDVKGDGNAVKRPDFGSLRKEDMLLVFPRGFVFNEIYRNIEDSGCAIMRSEAIAAFTYLGFPQLLTAIYT